MTAEGELGPAFRRTGTSSSSQEEIHNMDPNTKTLICWALHGAALLLTVAAKIYEIHIKHP